jgi:hypothetical protein
MFGATEKGVKLLTTKAKPGYAVGAINTRGGVGFDMSKPIYMKIAGNGLNKNDKYDGPAHWRRDRQRSPRRRRPVHCRPSRQDAKGQAGSHGSD